MLDKEKKHIQKELSTELVEIIKECEPDQELEVAKRVEYLIGAGADLNFSGFKPMHFATKRKHFQIIDVLVNAGALTQRRNIELIAHLCDYKEFDDKVEARFFELIDRCLKIAGAKEEYLTPYVNCMLINGKSEKLVTLGFRYHMNESDMAKLVYLRTIYEIIEFRRMKSLEFINRNIDWMDQATLDDAVLLGETAVVRYIFEHSDLVPTNKALLRAKDPEVQELIKAKLQQIKQSKIC